MRILLVEDDDSVRDITQRLLEARGYRVCCAASGRQGVDAYQADPRAFDLVLVDRNMPDIDGIAALCEMRRVNADVRALLMSGMTMTDIPTEALPTGFLMKPYGIDDLQAAVVAALAA